MTLAVPSMDDSPLGVLTEPDERTFIEMKEVLSKTQQSYSQLAEEFVMLEESYTSNVMAVDNQGWSPIAGLGSPHYGPNLSESYLTARIMRQLYAGNPIIKRGVNVRQSYVWGDGVDFDTAGTRGKPASIVSAGQNEKMMFSPEAYQEAETSLATDGTVFILVQRAGKQILRLPLGQINGFITNPDTGLRDDIRYYKRIWAIETITPYGQPQFQQVGAWYADISYTGPVPATIQGLPVYKAEAIVRVCANKQAGWIMGLPDLLPVAFWARAYKEFLESNFILTKTLAKYAWKVTSATPAGQKRSAAKLLAQIDPSQPNPVLVNRAGNTGTTFSATSTMDLQAVNKAGANVDFDAGRPLAAMVAAGLEISAATLLSDSKGTGAGEESLDNATVNMVTARQNLWASAFKQIFAYLGVTAPTVHFPPIQGDPLYRTVQAIVTAASTGVLPPQNVMDMLKVALRDFKIDWAGLPKAGTYAAYLAPANSSGANPATTPQVTPPGAQPTNDKQQTPAGPMSDGTNDNRATPTKGA
jgi:hypothetical protein